MELQEVQVTAAVEVAEDGVQDEPVRLRQDEGLAEL